LKDIDSQDWLELNYHLQRNDSNAASRLWAIAKRIDPRKVYSEWKPDPEKSHTGYQYYYTDEVRQNTYTSDMTHNTSDERLKSSRGRGGRPKALNEEVYWFIDFYKRIRKKSNREIAKIYGVSEITIRRALKEISNGSVKIFKDH
jgi:hypothetical protein